MSAPKASLLPLRSGEAAFDKCDSGIKSALLLCNGSKRQLLSA
jgi:hypothetical protein